MRGVLLVVVIIVVIVSVVLSLFVLGDYDERRKKTMTTTMTTIRSWRRGAGLSEQYWGLKGVFFGWMYPLCRLTVVV